MTTDTPNHGLRRYTRPVTDGVPLTLDLVLSWAEGHPDQDHRLAWLRQSGLTDEDVRNQFHASTSDHFWAAYDEVVGDTFRALGYDEDASLPTPTLDDFLRRMSAAQTADEARDLAIDLSHWESEQSLSYGELFEIQQALETLSERFPDLTDEFRENGLI